jgi:hypothetical protein
VAGRALTPATRRSLGEPLPHQLADRKIADPKAINLCSEEIMEYYPQFPMAILHLRVRSISLLTLPPLALAGPFDLHALTMPPAFSLSQNQTLHLNFFVPPEGGRSSYEDLKPVKTMITHGRSGEPKFAALMAAKPPEFTVISNLLLRVLSSILTTRCTELAAVSNQPLWINLN